MALDSKDDAGSLLTPSASVSTTAKTNAPTTITNNNITYPYPFPQPCEACLRKRSPCISGTKYSTSCTYCRNVLKKKCSLKEDLLIRHARDESEEEEDGEGEGMLGAEVDEREGTVAGPSKVITINGDMNSNGNGGNRKKTSDPERLRAQSSARTILARERELVINRALLQSSRPSASTSKSISPIYPSFIQNQDIIPRSKNRKRDVRSDVIKRLARDRRSEYGGVNNKGKKKGKKSGDSVKMRWMNKLGSESRWLLPKQPRSQGNSHHSSSKAVQSNVLNLDHISTQNQNCLNPVPIPIPVPFVKHRYHLDGFGGGIMISQSYGVAGSVGMCLKGEIGNGRIGEGKGKGKEKASTTTSTKKVSLILPDVGNHRSSSSSTLSSGKRKLGTLRATGQRMMMIGVYIPVVGRNSENKAGKMNKYQDRVIRRKKQEEIERQRRLNGKGKHRDTGMDLDSIDGDDDSAEDGFDVITSSSFSPTPNRSHQSHKKGKEAKVKVEKGYKSGGGQGWGRKTAYESSQEVKGVIYNKNCVRCTTVTKTPCPNACQPLTQCSKCTKVGITCEWTSRSFAVKRKAKAKAQVTETGVGEEGSSDIDVKSEQDDHPRKKRRLNADSPSSPLFAPKGVIDLTDIASIDTNGLCECGENSCVCAKGSKRSNLTAGEESGDAVMAEAGDGVEVEGEDVIMVDNTQHAGQDITAQEEDTLDMPMLDPEEEKDLTPRANDASGKSLAHMQNQQIAEVAGASSVKVVSSAVHPDGEDGKTQESKADETTIISRKIDERSNNSAINNEESAETSPNTDEDTIEGLEALAEASIGTNGGDDDVRDGDGAEIDRTAIKAALDDLHRYFGTLANTELQFHRRGSVTVGPNDTGIILDTLLSAAEVAFEQVGFLATWTTPPEELRDKLKDLMKFFQSFYVIQNGRLAREGKGEVAQDVGGEGEKLEQRVLELLGFGLEDGENGWFMKVREAQAESAVE